MSEGDWLRRAALLWTSMSAKSRGRTFVCSISFYDYGDGRHKITFFRYDPRFEGDDRGQVCRDYQQFTGASARRVQRLVHDGEMLVFPFSRTWLLKRFREWPRSAAEGSDE
jgi:hypothetical protein